MANTDTVIGRDGMVSGILTLSCFCSYCRASYMVAGITEDHNYSRFGGERWCSVVADLGQPCGFSKTRDNGLPLPANPGLS